MIRISDFYPEHCPKEWVSLSRFRNRDELRCRQPAWHVCGYSADRRQSQRGGSDLLSQSGAVPVGPGSQVHSFLFDEL